MSMLVFPKPSVNILVDNMSKQIILAGESSQFVLYTAADIFADNVYVSSKAGLCEQDTMKSIRQRTPSERRFWRSSSSNLGEDPVLEKYDDAMKLYRTAKLCFNMTHLILVNQTICWNRSGLRLLTL